MEFNMDHLVDGRLNNFYNNYDDRSYTNLNNYPYYSYNNLNVNPNYNYNNPTPTTSYDYSAGYDSPYGLAMDIGSEPMRQEIPKPDIFDFMSAPSETANNTAPVEVKETNNNHVTIDMASYGSDLWPTIDSSMLDDLNCWTQEGQGAKVDNTDGAIYTLTVLNGTDQTGWFKQEEKEEKIPNALDLDSLLNVIPSNFTNSFPTEAKSEFNFDESSFDDKKEEMCNNIVTEIVLTNSTGFNNNNEWKQGNNNEVDSLLRNALQGKSIVRYNGTKKEPEIKNDDEDKIINIENPILYENPSIIDSDNPSSAHSMDDMFLTHLDVSYPEDYEKLKRIETEVAASVEQFCLDRSYIPSGSQISSQMSPLIGLVTKPAKKYTKRSKSTTPTASSSSGVRKERSLHYCSICSKGFKDKYSVNVHIRTHTGEKPFTCSLCGKSFRQKAHLAKHYQTHMAQAKNGLSTSKSAKNLIPSS